MADPRMTDTQGPTPEADEPYRQLAIELWCDDELEIDPAATVSAGEGGAWVQAWVWVSNDEAGISELSEGEEQ